MTMAILHTGNPEIADYTPSGAVAVGDVVVTGMTPRIVHPEAIAAGVRGTIACDGGIWRVAGDAAIAADKKVWWVAASSKVSETAGANKPFGVTVEACSGDAVVFKVRHSPIPV